VSGPIAHRFKPGGQKPLACRSSRRRQLQPRGEIREQASAGQPRKDAWQVECLSSHVDNVPCVRWPVEVRVISGPSQFRKTVVHRAHKVDLQPSKEDVRRFGTADERQAFVSVVSLAEQAEEQKQVAGAHASVGEMRLARSCLSEDRTPTLLALHGSLVQVRVQMSEVIGPDARRSEIPDDVPDAQTGCPTEVGVRLPSRAVGMGKDTILPSGITGLGTPPEPLSKPLRLSISLIPVAARRCRPSATSAVDFARRAEASCARC
jgi:hypothetical protein